MTGFPVSSPISRRRMLRLGGLGGGLAVTSPALLSGVAGAAGTPAAPVPGSTGGRSGLPVAEIERIVRAQGTVGNGVLNIEIDRDDLPHVRTSEGVAIKPAFEINGNLCFQSLHGGSTMLNADLPFKTEELNPALDQMLAHGITWQAMHQHLFDLHPRIWFMHFRGRGSARRLAEGCAAILRATSTPLPQKPPAHPTTRLDPKRLAEIIGAPATVGADGVVGFQLPQRERITLGGVPINPFLNVYTSVDFQPLNRTTVVVADFGMLAGQIDAQAKVMRARGWTLECLYNQETDEHPQLYFSHQYKAGDAYRLAREVRRGLELTSVVIMD